MRVSTTISRVTTEIEARLRASGGQLSRLQAIQIEKSIRLEKSSALHGASSGYRIAIPRANVVDRLIWPAAISAVIISWGVVPLAYGTAVLLTQAQVRSEIDENTYDLAELSDLQRFEQIEVKV